MPDRHKQTARLFWHDLATAFDQAPVTIRPAPRTITLTPLTHLTRLIRTSRMSQMPRLRTGALLAMPSSVRQTRPGQIICDAKTIWWCGPRALQHIPGSVIPTADDRSLSTRTAISGSTHSYGRSHTRTFLRLETVHTGKAHRISSQSAAAACPKPASMRFEWVRY